MRSGQTTTAPPPPAPRMHIPRAKEQAKRRWRLTGFPNLLYFVPEVCYMTWKYGVPAGHWLEHAKQYQLCQVPIIVYTLWNTAARYGLLPVKMCCPGERVTFISSLWPPWKKIRRRAHNIQIIMYLFMVVTVADIAFQNGKQTNGNSLIKGTLKLQMDVEFSMPNCRGVSEKTCEVWGSKKQRSHRGGCF